MIPAERLRKGSFLVSISLGGSLGGTAGGPSTPQDVQLRPDAPAAVT